MNPNTTVFDNVSQAPTAAERVLNLALVALKRADFLEVGVLPTVVSPGAI